MKNNKKTTITLIILITFASILNFLPRLNYQYPLHIDEYVHFQYANHLSNNAPEYFGGDIENCAGYMTFSTQFSNGQLPKSCRLNNAVIHKITLENGFHVL